MTPCLFSRPTLTKKQDGKLVPQRSGVGGGRHGRSSVSVPSGLSSSTSSSSSSDYSELLISKLLAMKVRTLHAL